MAYCKKNKQTCGVRESINMNNPMWRHSPLISAAVLLTDSLLLALDRDCVVGAGLGMGGVLWLSLLSLSIAVRVARVL
jgi:hypothetical protein